MNDDLEALVREELDGTLARPERDRLAAELERDPAALAAYADQLQIEQRLRVVFGPEPSLAQAVVREISMLGDADRFSQGVVSTIKRRSLPRRIGEIAAAAVALVFLGFLLREGPASLPAAGRPTLLFVAGRLPLQPGDARVKSRLEGLGFRVEEKLDLDVQASDADGKAFVAISSTVLVRDIGSDSRELVAKFRDRPQALLVWEPRLFPELGMTSGAVHQKDWGTVHAQTTLTLAPPHPLAAGLSESVAVVTSPSQLSWGRPRPEAIRVATIGGDPERAAIFAYERGGSMPARRVGFFLFDETSLSPAGWTLFDAAVRWCAESR